MVILLTVIHIVVCLFLVIVVLLQSGKAADLAGAFGGMGSQTVFGPRGSATLLSKATTIAAAVFMVTSLSLSILATRAGRGSPGAAAKGHEADSGTETVRRCRSRASTVPITVTPSVDGKEQPKQVIPAPVIPNPNQQQKK